MNVNVSAIASDEVRDNPARADYRPPDGGIARTPAAHAVHFETEETPTDLLPEEVAEARETFLPVTRAALIDRLTRPQAWNAGEAKAARRFFKYLSYWRQQQHNAAAVALDQTYELFNPDSDMLMTRQFTDSERYAMQKRVAARIRRLLKQANYRRLDPDEIELVLTQESHYGLDFHLDLEAFEELEVYFRGASTRKDQRRVFRKFYRKEEFDVPIFQRLCILFKLKTVEQRIEEVMRAQEVDRAKATKIVKKLRRLVPEGVSHQNIYLKLFKNMPRSDVEMIFPNTRIKFRLMDKIKLGAMSSGAVGFGLVTSAGKIALLASNPIGAIGAVAGVGAAAFRQLMGFFNTRQKYMVVMAQNLYFHALADNRGVIMTLADRAADEDVKEEMLLYSVLAKETVRREDLPAVDRAIEQYLHKSFGINVDFDLDDALGRLLKDGVATEGGDGIISVLDPTAASTHIDEKWDTFLDDLPDYADDDEGVEFEGVAGGAVAGPEAKPKEVDLDT
ncbi:MAG: TMEM143 family protein [Hyphomicrobiaceae bacterium]